MENTSENENNANCEPPLSLEEMKELTDLVN